MFSKDQWLGFIRHVLTGVGGLFVAIGWMDEGTMTQVVGGFMTVIGFVWSWLDKR